MIEQAKLLVAEWLQAALTMEVLVQVAVVGFVLLLAHLLQFFVGRTPKGLKRRLRAVPNGTKILRIVHRVRLPLTAWILGGLALSTFRIFAWDDTVLRWAVPFLAIWFYYRLIVGIVEAGTSATQASFWRTQVLRPIAVLAVVLHATGLLDDVLDWRLMEPQPNLPVTVGTLLTGIVIVGLFVVFSRLAQSYLEDQFLPRAGIEPALTQAISNLVAYGVIVFGALFALSAIGIPLTMLTIIAGGLSVGLGFGLQDIVSNFISGFILMFERSIGPGDVIEVTDTYGVVESVGIRSVVIRTRDNISLIVPNSLFLNDVVTNYTQSESLVRAQIDVGVTYSADPREVEQALLEAAVHPRVLEQPPATVRFAGFGDSSLNFALLVWTEDAHRLPGLSSELRYQIWDALRARDIEIPFPQRDLHIRSGVPLSAEQMASSDDTT